MKNTINQEAEKGAEKAQSPAAVKRDVPAAYPFHLLQRDMNQLFENFAHGFEMWRPRFVEPLFGDFQVRLDLRDNDKDIVLTAEIPGVDPKDIELSVTDDSVVIRGEKVDQKEESEKGYYRSERSFGSFERVVPLPCEIDRDKVDATFKNGVLKVVLSKCMKSNQNEKKIEVKEST